ncbi:MAG TPA: hypothetical protein VJM50_04380 [Pyrinomonadaceae bacterium]|nr:hypothetical protein [Pyrinomonadaceae bacterium]
MSDFWKIENDPPPNSGVGNALNGLQIQPVFNSNTPPAITGYNLMNGSNLLSSTSSTSMPISFNNVNFASRTWDISANVPTLDVDGNGTWAIVGAARRPEDVADGDNGDFQAQAGTGIDPEAASKAYA